MPQFKVAKPVSEAGSDTQVIEHTPVQAAQAVEIGTATLTDYTPEAGGIQLRGTLSVYYSTLVQNLVYMMYWRNPGGKYDENGMNTLGTVVINGKNWNNKGIVKDTLGVMSSLVRRNFFCLPGFIRNDKDSIVALDIHDAEKRGLVINLGNRPEFEIDGQLWSFVFTGGDYGTTRGKADLLKYQRSQTPVWAIFSMIGSVLRYEEIASGDRAVFYGIMDKIGQGKSLLLKGLDLAQNARTLRKGEGPSEKQLPFVRSGLFYPHQCYAQAVLDTLAGETRDEMDRRYYQKLADMKLGKAQDAAVERSMETSPEVSDDDCVKIDSLALPLNEKWLAEKGDMWVKALKAAGVLEDNKIILGKVTGAITLNRYSKKSNNPITGSVKIDAINGTDPRDAKWLLQWNENTIDFGVLAFTPGQ